MVYWPETNLCTASMLISYIYTILLIYQCSILHALHVKNLLYTGITNSLITNPMTPINMDDKLPAQQYLPKYNGCRLLRPAASMSSDWTDLSMELNSDWLRENHITVSV